MPATPNSAGLRNDSPEDWVESAIRLFSQARHAPQPFLQPKAITAVNPVDNLEYSRISAGAFWMGAADDDEHAHPQERPRRQVRLSRPYWICTTPVTAEAYRLYSAATGRPMPNAPVFNCGWECADHPIVNVSYGDALAYCEWAGGRLPTEAEWEYAALGALEHPFPWGDEPSPDRGNFGQTVRGTTPVRRFAANDLGLHDMAGNVWEWCADWYGPYPASPQTDPVGPACSNARVLRGGSWLGDGWSARCTNRGRFPPDTTLGTVGFRCVWSVSPGEAEA